LRRHFAVLGLSLAIAFLCACAPALAYQLEPVVQDNLPTVSEHVARGGAASVPGVGCGTQCAAWWADEQAKTPATSASEDLLRAVRTVRTTSRVLPAFRALGGFFLAVDSFELGWRIGTGINTKWLKFGVPEEKIDPQSATWDRLIFVPANSHSYFGATWPAKDSWVGYFNYSGNLYDRWFQGACTFSGFSPPAPLSVQHAASPSTAQCYSPTYRTNVTVNPVKYAAIGEDELPAKSPVEDYGSQPYSLSTSDWTGKPTSASDLQSRVASALADDRNERAMAWYAHQLDPMSYADDPADDDGDDCALSSPSNEDPAPDRGTADSGPEFVARYDQVPEATPFPLTGLPTVTGQAYLYWGFTVRSDDPSIGWHGWGYRHIKAKHGWSQADLDATRDALLSGAPVEDDEVEGRYRYLGDEYPGTNGALCKRLVVVDTDLTEQDRDNGAPHPASIVTSFGMRVG
jgi:hypothetical protein